MISPCPPEMLIAEGKTILFDAGFEEKVSVEYLDNGDKRGVFFQTVRRLTSANTQSLSQLVLRLTVMPAMVCMAL